MNYTRPSAANSARLSDFYGQIVALSFNRDADVTTEYGRRIVPEASLVVIDLDNVVAISQGTTLVFPQVVAQKVRNARGDAVVGRLVKSVQANGRDLITIEDLDADDWDATIHVLSLTDADAEVDPAAEL